MYFRSAVDASPEDVLCMTLLGYYYAFVDEILESEHVLDGAQRLLEKHQQSGNNNEESLFLLNGSV